MRKGEKMSDAEKQRRSVSVKRAIEEGRLSPPPSFTGKSHSEETKNKLTKPIRVRSTYKRVVSLRESEQKVYNELTEEGWHVLRNGWPDFIAVKDGTVRFIEVKQTGDALEEHQLEMHLFLEKYFGVDVEVICVHRDRVDHAKLKRENWEQQVEDVLDRVLRD